MKRFILLFLFLTSVAAAQETDSSAMIFDQTIVHAYNLTFYVDGWADSLEYNYENGEEYMPARLEYNGLVFDSIGVRYKGNSSYMMSRGTPKKPFKFKFNKYKDDQTCYGEKKLNFSNCVKDPSFVREMLAYDIIGRFIPASRTAYATISVEGDLIGLYVQVEQVDKTFLKRHFEDNDFNLYKAADDGATLEYRGADKENYRAEYELETNESEDDWSRFITMLDLLNNTSDEDFLSTMTPWMNFDYALRLLALNMVLSNFDSYTGSSRNYYLYDDEISGQFCMLPWDFNEAFGAYSNNWNVVSQDIVSISNLDKRPLNRRVLANPVLRQQYLRYMREFIDGPAAYDSIEAKAHVYRTLIDSYVQADVNKLYTYQNFIDNLTREIMGGPNARIPGILPFTRDRSAIIRSQLGVYTSVDDAPAATSRAYIDNLESWPNPVTSQAYLRFQLQTQGDVTMTVSNLLGQVVQRRSMSAQSPGWQTVSLSFDGLQSGWYSCELTLVAADGNLERQTQRLLVLQ